jgi:hypothetical protein
MQINGPWLMIDSESVVEPSCRSVIELPDLRPSELVAPPLWAINEAESDDPATAAPGTARKNWYHQNFEAVSSTPLPSTSLTIPRWLSPAA